MTQPSSFGPSWQGSLADLAHILDKIKRTHAFGRLSLRNLEQVSIAHLYFRAGKLVHIVGHRGDARSILLALQSWKKAAVRFEPGIANVEATLGDEYGQLLDYVVAQLRQHSMVSTPKVIAQPQSPVAAPRIIEAQALVTAEAQELITPWEWRILVECIRRVSLAVAHLIGPREAYTVLQDVLDDCSASFPAFASLKIAPSGHLEITDHSQLDHMPRGELLEGFAALIAICQHFCVPIIGERDAHQLIIQALQELGPALVSLGVFRIDNRLLASRNT